MVFEGGHKVLAVESQVPLRDELDGLAGPLAFFEKRLRRLGHVGVVGILGSDDGSLGLFDNFHKGVE